MKPAVFGRDIDTNGISLSSFIFSELIMKCEKRGNFIEISKSMHVWKSSFNHSQEQHSLWRLKSVTSVALCCVG